MKDLNKNDLKKALAFCATGVCCTEEDECPLYGEHVCAQALAMNALSVIRELETNVEELQKIKGMKPENDRISKEDVQEFVDEFNALTVKLPKVMTLNDSRIKKAKVLLKKYGADAITEAITNLNKSSFLNGNNERSWVASFDWFIKEENFVKVLDGQYRTQRDFDKNYDAKAEKETESFFQLALERTYGT